MFGKTVKLAIVASTVFVGMLVANDMLSEAGFCNAALMLQENLKPTMVFIMYTAVIGNLVLHVIYYIKDRHVGKENGEPGEDDETSFDLQSDREDFEECSETNTTDSE